MPFGWGDHPGYDAVDAVVVVVALPRLEDRRPPRSSMKTTWTANSLAVDSFGKEWKVWLG